MLPRLTRGIERPGRKTNLHSHATKTILIGTTMRYNHVVFVRETVYLNEHLIRCADTHEYIRVLGRHTLPHVFQHTDSRHMFASARVASCPLRVPRLHAHYPTAMFRAKCYTTINWFTSIRPPTPYTLRILDAMATSTIRATAGWSIGPLAHFPRNVLEEGVGIPPSLVVRYSNFFAVYTRHRNHTNPLSGRSTTHSLLTALWRFQPQQPCLNHEFGRTCPAHPTDHDAFVVLCHHGNISIHLLRGDHLLEH